MFQVTILNIMKLIKFDGRWFYNVSVLLNNEGTEISDRLFNVIKILFINLLKYFNFETQMHARTIDLCTKQDMTNRVSIIFQCIE